MIHTCRHPCWHRALVLFGTLGYVYAIPFLWSWWSTNGFVLVGMYTLGPALLVTLLLWRCQGVDPRQERSRTAAALTLMGSAWLLTRDHDA